MISLLILALILIAIGYCAHTYLPRPFGTFVAIVCALVLVIALVQLLGDGNGLRLER